MAASAFTSSDLYATLGVASSASPEVIQAAYRALVKSSHPDRGGDPEVFLGVTAAYEVLSDPVARARYDADLIRAASTQSTSWEASPTWNFDDVTYERPPPRRRAPAPSFAESKAPIGFAARFAGVVALAALCVFGLVARLSGATYAVFGPEMGRRYLAWAYQGPLEPSYASGRTWVPFVVVLGAIAGGVWLRRERLGVFRVERAVLVVTVLALAAAGEFILSSSTGVAVVAVVVLAEALLWWRAKRRAA